MEKKLEFTRETYDKLKKGAAEGKLECDVIGTIEQGAVSCEFKVVEEEGYKDEDYCIGGKYFIDADYFLLGKDTGYNETENGTPYDCPSGFVAYLKDTYEETVEGFMSLFDECMKNDEELIAGTKEETLTWENERIKAAV